MKIGDRRELRESLRSAFLLAAGTFVIGAFASASVISSTSSEKAQFMFVQTAADVKVAPWTSLPQLAEASRQTLCFSDRPLRIAGHISLASYIREWTSRAGKDNFSADPLNTVLSVYELRQEDTGLFAIKMNERAIPAAGAATLLFNDRIAAGCGAGSGFRGVGAGYRSPGWHQHG